MHFIAPAPFQAVPKYVVLRESMMNICISRNASPYIELVMWSHAHLIRPKEEQFELCETPSSTSKTRIRSRFIRNQKYAHHPRHFVMNIENK